MDERKVIKEDTIGEAYGRGRRIFHPEDKVQYLEGGNVIVTYIGDDEQEHKKELTKGEFEQLLDVSRQLSK